MCKLPHSQMETEIQKVLQKQKQLEEENKKKAIELLKSMERRNSFTSTISFIEIGGIKIRA